MGVILELTRYDRIAWMGLRVETIDDTNAHPTASSWCLCYVKVCSFENLQWPIPLRIH